jgi:hypothetical protein
VQQQSTMRILLVFFVVVILAAGRCIDSTPRSVAMIADDREPDRGHVGADLMGAAGLELGVPEMLDTATGQHQDGRELSDRG